MGSGVFSSRMAAKTDTAVVGNWRVVEISNGSSGELAPVGDGELQMYLVFSDGYATLKAGGCGIGGEVDVSNGSYQVLRYLTTALRDCEPEARAQEVRLYNAFYDKGQYDVAGLWLTLSDTDGRPKIRAIREN